MIIVCFSYSYSLYAQNEKKTCTDCHESLIKQEYIHPVAEDACDNCHQSSDKEHPNSIGPEFSLSESVPDLCYMCHEGLNTKKNVHAPITDGYCMMCHSAHGSSNASLLKVNPVEKTCYECHDLEIPDTDVLHMPVKEGKCNGCHDPHQSDNNSFLKNTKPQLCFNCHEDVKKQADLENIHYPFDDDCSTCHKSHSSNENYLMSEKTPDLCFNCHDGFKESSEKSKSSHSIVFDKTNCANCHSPHASSYSSLLKHDGKDLCLSCHNKTIKTNTEVIENIAVILNKAKSVHAAIEMDGCASCHKSHSSEYRDLLIGEYPSSKYVKAEVENFALCFECHDSELLEKEFTTSATNFRTAERNMHYLHVKGKKGRNCSLCHDVHASKNERLIHEKRLFGNWEMSMNFKLTKTGGSCFPGCHAEKSYER